MPDNTEDTFVFAGHSAEMIRMLKGVNEMNRLALLVDLSQFAHNQDKALGRFIDDKITWFRDNEKGKVTKTKPAPLADLILNSIAINIGYTNWMKIKDYYTKQIVKYLARQKLENE